jgi:esterase/lipase superfamily enzyme
MTPFCLDIAPDPDGTRIACTWYGDSTQSPAGTLPLPRAPAAADSALPARFTIDLAPPLAEVAAGLIPDAAALATADDLLPLRDLLDPAAYRELCEALYLFLWRAAVSDVPLTPETGRWPQSRHWPRTSKSSPAVTRGPGGRPWANHDRRLVRVWFATNRLRLLGIEPDETGDQGFSDTESAEGLSFGQCSVLVPESHRPGETGTAWWRRLIRLRSDDRLRVHATVPLPESVFWGRLARTLADEWKLGRRNLFVLIHGYNVSFGEAAIRAAQLGYDLKVPGEIAFFSWPSRGTVFDYAADEATIGASVGPLAGFLEGLCTKSGAERVHLFVHSMGNRGLLGALERLAAAQRPPLRLGQVFFCAPDEDVRTFADRTRRFPQQCENRTLLVSPEDWAVRLSRLVHRQDRVGHVPPFHAYAGIETVAVMGFGLLDLGHGYFAEARDLIQDMREAIDTRRPAAERFAPEQREGYFEIDLGR